MAEAFIGLGVHVVLTNDSWVEGTVSHIDQHTQQLTLKNVTVNVNGLNQQLPIYGVAGTQIKDLQILPTRPPTSTQQQRVETAQSVSDTASAPNNISKPSTSQYQAQLNTLLPKSPFSDPAIISISQAPINSASNSSIPFTLPRLSPYFSQSLMQKQHPNNLSNNFVIGKSSKTVSTDSESKLDDEEDRDSPPKKQYAPSKNHQNGADSSGSELEGTISNQRRGSRKKKSDTNGYYHNLRESPARQSVRRRRQAQHEWAGEDVNEFKSEEFDFQGNLDLFDKEKVFAEIRELDSTAPESLLVNINRNPNYHMNHRNGRFSAQAQQQRLASYENVLEPSRRKSNFYQTDEEDETANDGEVDSDGSWKHNKQLNGTGVHRNVKIRTLTGVVCPTVQPSQMIDVERIAETETGPNEDQMIENAGRGTSMMCLKALGGSRRIQPNNHNAAPLVVILIGNNKTGAYGLAAARHLANHGCHVIAFVVGKEKDLLKSVAYQQKIMLSTGGKLVKDIADLPQQFTNPVDLIVDALLGYQFSLRDTSDEHDRKQIYGLMEWANINKAPVLSLDMPSGINGSTGNPTNAAHHIRPKWTLCLGAPKTGCKSRSVTGELFLTDIGIPRICWKKIGVKGWGMPWGSEYLIGLEYAS